MWIRLKSASKTVKQCRNYFSLFQLTETLSAKILGKIVGEHKKVIGFPRRSRKKALKLSTETLRTFVEILADLHLSCRISALSLQILEGIRRCTDSEGVFIEI